MQQEDGSLSVISLDKRMMSIDLEALNLLQTALFTRPKEQLALELKRKFGIYSLSPFEVEQELKAINSPLRKYLTNMMISLVRRAEMLLSVSMQTYLTQKLGTRIKRYCRLLVRLLRRYGKQTLLGQRRKIRLVNWMMLTTTYNMQPIDFTTIRPYVMEAHRYDLMMFYLQHTEAKRIPVVEEMINSHINMLSESFQKYEELIQINHLTAEELLHFNEWLVVSAKRIQAINLERVNDILTHLPLHDTSCLKQYLLKTLTNDLIAFRHLEKIHHIQQNQLPLTVPAYNEPATPRNAHPQEHETISLRSFDLHLLHNKINDYFNQVLIQDKNVFIDGSQAILLFMNDLIKIAHNPHSTVQNKLHTKTLSLIKILKEASIDYTPLIATIAQLCQQLSKQLVALSNQKTHNFKVAAADCVVPSTNSIDNK